MVAAPLDPLHRLYRRREQEGSSRMGAVVRLLVPMCGDGIVAEEGLLPGEPLPASVSTRGHAKKTGTPPRPRHIPYCTYGQACIAYLAPCIAYLAPYGLGRSQHLLANVHVWMLLAAAAVHVCLVCPCCFVFSPPHPRQIKFLSFLRMVCVMIFMPGRV
uniref:Uncharacterized protein n=1 Tax=Triticum urartu TaxID=4572 RepID=A0A8R7PUH6_TRIUA